MHPPHTERAARTQPRVLLHPSRVSSPCINCALTPGSTQVLASCISRWYLEPDVTAGSHKSSPRANYLRNQTVPVSLRKMNFHNLKRQVVLLARACPGCARPPGTSAPRRHHFLNIHCEAHLLVPPLSGQRVPLTRSENTQVS